MEIGGAASYQVITVVRDVNIYMEPSNLEKTLGRRELVNDQKFIDWRM
jgi:hypothetical protein